MNVMSLATDSNEEILEEAARVLKQGGVIIYPTDTLYGLGADARKDECVSKVIALKGRAESKPISVVVSDFRMLREYAEIPEEHLTLLKRTLPGKFTVILKAKDSLSAMLSPDSTVGFRIPANPLCIGIVEKAGFPITSTSANKAGQPTLGNIDTILPVFGKKVDLYVDFGECHGIPSTVVDMTGKQPKVVRKGANMEILKEFL